MSWISSASLKCGMICSRLSLTQLSASGDSHWGRACVRRDDIVMLWKFPTDSVSLKFPTSPTSSTASRAPMGRIPWKPLEIETWFKRTTNTKWPMPSRMVTWPMTSRNLERQGRDPIMFGALYLKNGWNHRLGDNGGPIKRPPGNPLVKWPMTSLNPERSQGRDTNVSCPLSRKRLEIVLQTWWQ